MLACAEFLQGGGNMERSLPSKCAAPFGHYDGKKPVRNDIGMDGEWKYQ
jgi:hypothetical protein